MSVLRAAANAIRVPQSALTDFLAVCWVPFSITAVTYGIINSPTISRPIKSTKSISVGYEKPKSKLISNQIKGETTRRMNQA